ncbi:hypothetical protein TVAG_425540 [Trichomonas vaginalis G3]|uniref:Ubiquitin-like domain-containing protein n=1 Tax=Trichomonas vaginalis (strain ATCC PRA-98 / G3) TaxID=412133 RepID=A2FI88_TRIV3|nr:hypothetical protein TVAGG3_0723270 [Trichomonas vaginalis G3]EAX95370.1 hypothetical protein TVAG_425540 [Trichomonas vaginalis G3]KAI5510738.1 hypothetical protein TVAGG3_0723270 [Trichomonas vaginalis G3]|eukprot:XP_001308300.1 hypothetical protein [Trichomonas vaginalis G3]
MDSFITFNILCSDGRKQTVSGKRSQSLREVFSDYNFLKSNSTEYHFIKNRLALHIDISLGALGITDGDTVFVIKRNIAPKINYPNNTALEESVCREAIRMSDIQFSHLELFKRARNVYSTYFKHQSDFSSSEIHTPVQKSYIAEAATSVSQTSLPMLWTSSGKPYIRCPIYRNQKNVQEEKCE